MDASTTPVAPAELRVKNFPLPQALCLLPILHEYVAVEVARGSTRESFLFARGALVASASVVERLRFLLADEAAVEVTMLSHDSLAALYGKPISAMELVIDPSGALAT